MIRLMHCFFRQALGKSSIEFQVSHTARLKDAVSHLHNHCVDVVVLDLGLPDGVGLGSLATIQEASSRVPVVILTGRDDHQLATDAVRSGAQDYLTKESIDQRQVARSLTYAIQRKKAETELRDDVTRLQEAADVDPLTGLLNRRAFFSRISESWDHAENLGVPLACAVLDIDYFKKVNDTYGHSAGDTALVAIAQVLQKHTRTKDIVCRYGGEEFCILLVDADENAAMLWADRTRLAIGDMTIATNSGGFNLTASVGIARGVASRASAEQLIDQADQALLVSKQRGRNRVTAFSSLDDNVSLADLNDHPVESFQAALARDYMTSPIHCLRDSDTIGEAAEQLLDMRINSIPIVDQTHCLVGIVSEKDLIEFEPSGRDWNSPVSKVMNTTVVSFEADTPLKAIRSFLSRVSMRRVVIVEDNRPVGVLSRSDLLQHFHDWSAQNTN